jgi:hypothetical protein
MSAREKHTHEARAGDGDQGIRKLRCMWRTEVAESQRAGSLPQSRGRSSARGDSTGKGTPRHACEEEEKDGRPDNEGQAGPPEAARLGNSRESVPRPSAPAHLPQRMAYDSFVWQLSRYSVASHRNARARWR